MLTLSKPGVTPLLVVNPGHGGKDNGAQGNGILEDELNLQISLYQFQRFQQLGLPVAITRTDDTYQTPDELGAMVRGSGAKYCISNHNNAGGGDGVECIHSIYSDGKLAWALYNAITAAGQNGRRVFFRTYPGDNRQDYYFMHRLTRPVDTVIIEYGFVDHAADASQLKENWELWAEAVVKAFCEHVGYAYSSPQTPSEYTVKGNDTLGAIAARYGLNVGFLARINNLDNPNMLQVGQVLRLIEPKDPLAEALKTLKDAGIINSPDYWLENARPGRQAEGEYVGYLLLNMAAKLRR